MAATGPMIMVPAAMAAGDNGDIKDQMAAALFAAKAACMYTGTGTGDTASPALIDIDLAAQISSAASQLAALNPKAENYETEKAKLVEKFSGPIFDALFEEVKARRSATEATTAFNTAKMKFLQGERTALKGADDQELMVDGVTQREAAGAERALYQALTYGVVDDPLTDDPDESIPAAVRYRVLSGVTYIEADDIITGITVDGSQNVMDLMHPFTAQTMISDIVALRATAQEARDKAQAVLDADGTAKGITLTEREKSHLTDLVKFRDLEIDGLNATIATFETSTDANRKVVQEYRTADALLETLKDASDDAKKAQSGKKKATVAALVDPVMHLDTLIALAGDDEARKTRAQLIKDAYLAATADSENPASALLDELLYGDDSGQALVTAVSDTYGVAKAATAAVDGNTAKNAEQDIKLAAKKMYIDNLGLEMGFDAATGMGTGANGMSRIDVNEADIGLLDGRVTVNEGAIGQNVIDIATNAAGITVNEMGIGSNLAAIGVNTDAIGANATNITANERNISGNTAMIGELSESLEVVRAGVAASMALAGMPAINGRGVSIGVGSFDGESAFAIGFQIQNDTTSFKVGVTSGGGATGASAGVGFQF